MQNLLFLTVDSHKSIDKSLQLQGIDRVHTYEMFERLAFWKDLVQRNASYAY